MRINKNRRDECEIRNGHRFKKVDKQDVAVFKFQIWEIMRQEEQMSEALRIDIEFQGERLYVDRFREKFKMMGFWVPYLYIVLNEESHYCIQFQMKGAIFVDTYQSDQRDVMGQDYSQQLQVQMEKDMIQKSYQTDQYSELQINLCLILLEIVLISFLMINNLTTILLIALLTIIHTQTSLTYTYAFSTTNLCYNFNHIFDVFMTQTATVTLRTDCNSLLIYNGMSSNFGGNTGKVWTTFTSSQNFNYGISRYYADWSCSNICCCNYHCQCSWQLSFTLILDFALVSNDHQYNCQFTTCTSCRSDYIFYNNYCRTPINYCKAFLSITNLNQINMDYYFSNNLCKTCAQTIPNCLTCSALTVCTSCINGYALDSLEQCILCSSFPGMSNCQTCSDNQTCTLCTSTQYALDAGAKCSLCASFTGLQQCVTCSNNNICLTCLNTQYALNSALKCVVCSAITGLQNCQTCTNNNTCTLCTSNQYALNTAAQCFLCSSYSGMANCATCSNYFTCTTCTNTQYALTTAAKCSLCSSFTGMSNCFTCSDRSTCTGCSSTNYALNPSNKCQLCSVSLTNCLTCTSLTVCISCVSTAYAIDSTEKCQTCASFIVNCSTCSNNSTCLTCIAPNLLRSNLCRLCPQIVTNCNTCSSAGICLTCLTGYGLDTSSSPESCRLCSDGVTNCVQCTTHGHCSKCIDTHYVQQSTDPITLGVTYTCELCTIMSDCLKCTISTACLTCQQGFAVNTTNLCQACSVFMSKCLTCSNRLTCTLCEGGYALDSTFKCRTCGYFMAQCITCSSNFTCTSCNPGYIPNAGNCVSCGSYMPNCNLCSDKFTCLGCIVGFAINSTHKCQPCSVFIPQCATCTDNNTCTSCKTGFFVFMGACKTCPQIIQNCNSCSSNVSCSACDPGTVLKLGRCPSCQDFINHCGQCSDTNTCTTCIDPYVVDFRKKCNKCKSPLHYVSDLCSNQIFCISAYKDSNNNVICNFCDFTKNYVIDPNNKCVCQKGFINIKSICQEICGDGLIFKSQCDDNNTFNGDGCSSSCMIQPEFNCYKLKSGISKCKLDKNIKFKLDYVDKVMNENKALIYINLDTDNQNVRRFYESALFNFTVTSNRSQTITILNFEKNSKNNIVIEIEYNVTIEDSAINLNFGFPKDFVTSENQNLKFILKGNNFALIISNTYKKYDQVSQIQIYFIASSYVIVLAFLFSQKFIAVEALVSFQMVFFSLLMIYRNSDWTQGLTTVLPLKYSMGFNQLLYEQTHFANLQDQTFNKYRYLRMCEPFLMNNFTNSAILTVLSVIFLFLFYIKTRKENQMLSEENPKLKSKAKKSLRRFVKIFKKVYNLTFNFSYIMIFEVMVSLYIETAYMKSISPELKMLSKFAAIWTFTVIIFTILDQFKHLFLKKEDTHVEDFRVGIIESRYKAVYLSYVMFNAIIMCLLNDKIIYNVPPSAILGFFAVLYLIFIMVYRPYQYSFGIHGFTIIVNQLIYMMTLALVTAINFGVKFDEVFLLMFCYTLLGFCVLIIFLTFFRVFLDYKYGTERVLEEMRKQIAQRKKNEEVNFVRRPLQIETKDNTEVEAKHKRNKYLYKNRVKEQEQINYLNELKAKSFLTQEERDSIYYKFFKEKPLKWVQKHEKKAKYEYLMQREKEDLEKDTEKKELDRRKEEKLSNNTELNELKMLKDKMRVQYEQKKQEKDKKKRENKRKKLQEKEKQTGDYADL